MRTGNSNRYGAVAHLGERLACTEKAEGSNPSSSTKDRNMRQFDPYKCRMQEINHIGLIKCSAWLRVTGSLNKLCGVKRHRVFVRSGGAKPMIKGKKGKLLHNTGSMNRYEYRYSTYGIHVGVDWLYKEYPFIKTSVEHCTIIKELYNLIPGVTEKSYKECLKYKKMIAFV